MKKIMTRLFRIKDIPGLSIMRCVMLQINSCGIVHILIRTLLPVHKNSA